MKNKKKTNREEMLLDIITELRAENASLKKRNSELLFENFDLRNNVKSCSTNVGVCYTPKTLKG